MRRKNLAQHQQEDVYIHLSLQTAFATQKLSERDQKLEKLSLFCEQKYQELTREIAEHCEKEIKQKEELLSSFKQELTERDKVITQLSLKLDEKDVLVDALRQGVEEMKVKLEESQKDAHENVAKKLNDLAKELEEKQENSIKAVQGEQLAKIEDLENNQKAMLSKLKAGISDSHRKSAEHLECEIKRVSLDIGKTHADLEKHITAFIQREHHLIEKGLELCEKKVSKLEKMQGELHSRPEAIPH